MSRQITTCGYCAGDFCPRRSDARYCSGACRQAAHHARTAAEVDPPSLRRETWCRQRAEARVDGIGLLTRREAWEADLRVRREAGLEAW